MQRGETKVPPPALPLPRVLTEHAHSVYTIDGIYAPGVYFYITQMFCNVMMFCIQMIVQQK